MNRTRHGSSLVFISYRSHDESSTAYLLFRELTDRFGENVAFRDADSIPPGADAEQAILDAVHGCAVLLVVMGTDWLRAADGRRALDRPDDWVRREILEALALGVQVVPVLVGDISLPPMSELPEPLQRIARHQFVRIRHRYEHDDIDVLLAKLIRLEPRLAAGDRLSLVAPARRQAEPRPATMPDWVDTAVGMLAAPRPVATPDRLDAAATLLAAQVFQQASDAVQAWQLDTPKVVTRWRFADSPHRTVSTWTSGDQHSVAELAARVRGLPRTRLAVLGEGGSGKTSLAMLLIRELARHHTTGDRVPVLVPLTGWDPDTESPHAWLTSRLVKDYPALRAAEFGKDAAGTLVRQRRVLAVLDGLDELPPDTQRRAMRLLSQLADDDAWIVTCRTEVFTGLPAAHRAGVDATLTALPLSARESAGYLHQLVHDDDRWQPVLRELAEDPDTPLAKALQTPLTLWLLRQTYVDADPARLATMTDPEQVRRHLLTQLVPTVLARRQDGSPFRPRHRWPPDRAHRWLWTLARSLTARATTELAWWQLSDLGPRRPQLVLAAVLAVATVLLVGGATVLTAGWQGLVPAEMITLAPAVAVAFCSPERPAPAFASFRLRGRFRRLFGHLVKGAIAGVLLGGLFFLAAQVAEWTVPGYFRPLAPLEASSLGLALGMGVGFFRWAGVATSLDEARTPATVLRADRRLTLVVASTVAIVLCALTMYAMSSTVDGPVRLAIGLAMLPVWATWVAFGSLTSGRTQNRLTGYAWPGYLLSIAWAATVGHLPWRLMPFLADMHRLGILRQVGAAYQFRHTDVRDVLAGSVPRRSGGSGRDIG